MLSIAVDPLSEKLKFRVVVSTGISALPRKEYPTTKKRIDTVSMINSYSEASIILLILSLMKYG